MQCEHPGCSCGEDGVERDGRKYCSVSYTHLTLPTN